MSRPSEAWRGGGPPCRQCGPARLVALLVIAPGRALRGGRSGGASVRVGGRWTATARSGDRRRREDVRLIASTLPERCSPSSRCSASRPAGLGLTHRSRRPPRSRRLFGSSAATSREHARLRPFTILPLTSSGIPQPTLAQGVRENADSHPRRFAAPSSAGARRSARRRGLGTPASHRRVTLATVFGCKRSWACYGPAPPGAFLFE